MMPSNFTSQISTFSSTCFSLITCVNARSHTNSLQLCRSSNQGGRKSTPLSKVIISNTVNRVNFESTTIFTMVRKTYYADTVES